MGHCWQSSDPFLELTYLPYFFALVFGAVFLAAGFAAAFVTFFLLPMSFSAKPGLNLPFVFAGILISLPVAGLRPIRAARDTAENVPKPIRVTLSPALSADSTEPVKATRAFSACTLEYLHPLPFLLQDLP
jgi:hypothetical protein